MKKVLIGVWLAAAATMTWASCSSHTIWQPNGQVIMCTTCCNFGSCTTTCF